MPSQFGKEGKCSIGSLQEEANAPQTDVGKLACYSESAYFMPRKIPEQSTL
jgi:hypothetical protein